MPCDRILKTVVGVYFLTPSILRFGIQQNSNECDADSNTSVFDLVADAGCNLGANNDASGPGPYYRAVCDTTGELLFFLSAQCTDPNCLDCDTNSIYLDNNNADGWDVSAGDCNVLNGSNAFQVLGTDTREPTVSPTTFPTTIAPTATQTCDWEIDYFGTADGPTDACRNGAPEETAIVADGTCRFNSRIDYYRAFCSETDGALTFTQAHCEVGCVNCQPFEAGNAATPNTSFIRVGNEYSPSTCYLINNVVNGETSTVRHSWTVEGTCREIQTCEIVPEEPTAAPIAPTGVPTVTPSLRPTTLRPTLVPTSVPSQRPITLEPTGVPTAAPVTAIPTLEPTSVPTAAPVTSIPTGTPAIPETCDWSLDYFGTAAIEATACSFATPQETPIVADGTCRFNDRVSFYRAFCSGVGGALTFSQAHCDEGCVNCQPYVPGETVPTTSFIQIGSDYSPDTCYVINNTVDGTILHAWTVSGTCLEDTCVEVAPDSEPTAAPISLTARPTLAPTNAPVVAPTLAPTSAPVVAPTNAPTNAPIADGTTAAPVPLVTGAPVASVTTAPTDAPTNVPSVAPIAAPTAAPVTAVPTTPPGSPTASPVTAAPATAVPTASPVTQEPTVEGDPTSTPTFDTNRVDSTAPTPDSGAVASTVVSLGTTTMMVALAMAWFL